MFSSSYENSPYREVLVPKALKISQGRYKIPGRLQMTPLKAETIHSRIKNYESGIPDDSQAMKIKEYMQKKIIEHYKQKVLEETKKRFTLEIEKRYQKSEANKTYIFPRKMADMAENNHRGESDEEEGEFNTESLNQSVIDLRTQNEKKNKPKPMNVKHFLQLGYNHDQRQMAVAEPKKSSFEGTTAGLQNKIKNKMIQESGREDLFKTSFTLGVSPKVMKQNSSVRTVTLHEESNHSITLPSMKSPGGRLSQKISPKEERGYKVNLNENIHIRGRPKDSASNQRRAEAKIAGLHNDYDKYYRSMMAKEIFNTTAEENASFNNTFESKNFPQGISLNESVVGGGGIGGVIIVGTTIKKQNNLQQSPQIFSTATGAKTMLSQITPRERIFTEYNEVFMENETKPRYKDNNTSSINLKINAKKYPTYSNQESSIGSKTSVSVTSLISRMNKISPRKKDIFTASTDNPTFVRNKLQGAKLYPTGGESSLNLIKRNEANF
jgi:hypothetical protein